MTTDSSARNGVVGRRPRQLKLSWWTRRDTEVTIPAPRTALDDAVTPPDSATRHLCAGAHRSDVFGDMIIAEALAQPLRALPPCPGADAPAVLRDAVAARIRRRVRDGTLVVLLVSFALLHPVTFAVWSTAAVLIRRRIRTLDDDGAIHGWLRVAAPITSILAAAVLLVLAAVDSWWLPTQWPVPAAVLLTSMAGLVLLDEALVTVMVRHWFHSGRFVADARDARSGLERTLRGAGRRGVAAALARVTTAHEHVDAAVDVVVHRGYRPLVGAGIVLDHVISITRPLQPAEGAETKPVRTSELHEAVGTAVRALATSRSLAAGQGMGRLRHREQVVVHADRLVTHRTIHPGPEILPDLRHPPVRHLSRKSARGLADHPVEWARYYGCFQVESWGGELATSTYLYATIDSSTIYLTLTHCVLPPNQPYFGAIDYTTPAGQGAAARAAQEFLRLPLTGLPRLLTALGYLPHRPRRRRMREIDPARYGAEASVRELAAGQEYRYANQKADVDQYLELVRVTVLRAVTGYLADHGYDIVEFEKAALATRVVNNVTVSGGTHIGGQYVAGLNAGTTTTTPPPKDETDQ